MSKDDLKTGGMLKSKEILILDSAIRRKKLELDALEKEVGKLSNSVVRTLYCLQALVIITLFLHLGSVFYTGFPLEALHYVMVSATLGSYMTKLMFDIRSERKRFCLLDESKK